MDQAADRAWSDIPYFRKPWFLVLLILIFMPGYLIMLWTGDTYHRKQGVVYKTSRQTKIRMTVLIGVLIAGGVLREMSKMGMR